MIKQEHRGMKKEQGHGFFIVNTIGHDALFKELDAYCKDHPEQSIGIYILPVVPQKVIPVPEYAMEIIINPECIFPMWYRMYQ